MRYFFHYLAGNGRLDDDLGLEHASPGAARAEAIRAAREMIADALRRNEPIPADGVIEITDDHGQLVGLIPLQDVAFDGVSDGRYRRLFANSPEACLLLGPDLTIVDANPAYLRKLAVDLKAIVGRPLFEVFPENPGTPDGDGKGEASASLDRVRRERVPHTLAVRYDIRRDDGSWQERHWQIVNTPILDGDGNVEFILQRSEDVTGARLHARSAAG